MITGYNTDVRHRDVLFHVQTEDKGAGNPLIESLVYVGGQVLATRRASYSALLANGDGEDVGKAVLTLMDRQHRTVIAAIRSGRFDAKLADLPGRRSTETTTSGSSSTSTGTIVAAAGAPPAPPVPSRRAPPPPPPTLGPARSPRPAAAKARPAAPPSLPSPPSPADVAVAIERTLDQVILEYLTNEAEQEHLQLDLQEAADLALGQRASLLICARSSRSGEGVAGAQVTVKMISTVDSPHALAHGATGAGGSLRLVFDIPVLSRGTAALIVSAASPLGRAEIKQLL